MKRLPGCLDLAAPYCRCQAVPLVSRFMLLQGQAAVSLTKGVWTQAAGPHDCETAPGWDCPERHDILPRDGARPPGWGQGPEHAGQRPGQVRRDRRAWPHPRRCPNVRATAARRVRRALLRARRKRKIPCVPDTGRGRPAEPLHRGQVPGRGGTRPARGHRRTRPVPPHGDAPCANPADQGLRHEPERRDRPVPPPDVRLLQFCQARARCRCGPRGLPAIALPPEPSPAKGQSSDRPVAPEGLLQVGPASRRPTGETCRGPRPWRGTGHGPHGSRPV